MGRGKRKDVDKKRRTERDTDMKRMTDIGTKNRIGRDIDMKRRGEGKEKMWI